jgi:hypothetical protein
LPVSFISLRLERVDNLGAYRIPPETGILIPSDFVNNVPRAYEEVLHILSLKARIISTESPFGGAE